MYALQLNRCYREAPRWQPANQFIGGNRPLSAASWLLDRGSLTAHLRRESGGDFHVQVLRQYWGTPQLSERRLLELGDRDWAMIREVLLCCRQQPWVYARSILPVRSMTGHLRRLRGLDSRPLGHLLFADRRMRREAFELCRVAACALPVPALQQDTTELWGRRSCFANSDRRILVGEIFLPAFQPW